MSTYMLTSMFPNGFNRKIAEILQQKICKRNKFAFVASEFEKMHEKTDQYFKFFINMFADIDIHFQESYIVDARMSADDMKRTISEADVVWLSGGNTPVQFYYFQKYGLENAIKQHKGIVIGMSAGSINMAKTAICTLSCGHDKLMIYNGLGCVDISVEPHFVRSKVSNELIELSNIHTIYGLCDDSIIVSSDDKSEFYGEIYKITCGGIEPVC